MQFFYNYVIYITSMLLYDSLKGVIMSFTKKAATFLATIVLSTTTSTVIVTNAQAATFTKDEIQEVHQIQNQYKNLPKDNFNADTLYASNPHLTAPFSPGSVTNSYITSQLDYINFYFWFKLYNTRKHRLYSRFNFSKIRNIKKKYIRGPNK